MTIIVYYVLFVGADKKMKVIIETSINIIFLPYDYDNSLFDELLCKSIIVQAYSLYNFIYKCVNV